MIPKNPHVQEMIELRKQRYTYQRIGDQFNLTRERVRQLLKEFAPELTGKGRADRVRTARYVTRVCARCGKAFPLYDRLTRMKFKRNFCSWECWMVSRNPFPETPSPEVRADPKAYRKWKYEMDRKYRPEHFAERQRKCLESTRRYLATPEGKRKHAEYMIHYWRKRKAAA